MRPGGSGGRSGGRVPNAAVAAAMSGAVDLAAVKARSEAAARAAAAPPPTSGHWIIDADETNFQAEVIDRSFQVPVLLDLWADWCQPCKQLTPILEKVADEYAGAWVLAKIDTEANPRIAQMLQVQGIPATFAVIGGQLVPGFTGAIPEPQVREFIAALLDAAAQAGLAGPGPDDGAERPSAPARPEPPEDPRLVEAENAIDAGDFDRATAVYQSILDVEPVNTEVQLALKQVSLMKRLAGLSPSALADAEAAPDDVALQLAAADAEVGMNQMDAAFARLIGLVRRLRGEERTPVRERLVEYFDLLGPDDPRVGPARRELANALF